MFTKREHATIDVVLRILPELEITKHEVMEKLTKFNIDKSPGPDRMHPHVLHRLRKELVAPLTKLFQLSAASFTF